MFFASCPVKYLSACCNFAEKTENIMRLKTVLISLLVSTSCMVAYGENTKEVVVITKRASVGDKPNTEVPVACEKDSDAGVLDFTFTDDVGNVVVEVLNIVTEERISTTINSAYGLGTVAISWQDGVYKVTLKTSDGEYVGYFNN